MKKEKDFDCVEMKWAIQRKLEEECPDLPEKERRDMQMDRVRKNPILGPLLEQIERRNATAVTRSK